MTVLSYSVQSINFVYYITGIIGVYKLFNLYKIDNSLILLSLTAFNFFSAINLYASSNET